MNVRDVTRLIEAMTASDLAELEFEQRNEGESGSFRIVLRRAVAAAPAPAPLATTPPVAASLGATARDNAPGADAPTVSVAAVAPAAAPAPAVKLIDVVAPIVGTFYASPAPDSANYVKVGDRVKPGTVLCIIEAMKLMNEIEAEVAGTVVEVLVANEDPVEYGQVLFRIDPS
jgi:acetyl-CoA carboxylase biotin carboxyl carrier protein